MNIAQMIEVTGARGVTVTKSVTHPGEWGCTIYAPGGKSYYTHAPTPEEALTKMEAKLLAPRLPDIHTPRLPGIVTR